MKTLILLALVVMIEGRPLENVDLPIPQIKKITAVDPPGFEIVWEPVTGDITGYQVKVWELPTAHALHYEIHNGQKVLVDDVKPPKFPTTDDIPESKPRVFSVPASEPPTLLVKDVKLNTVYEVRVQAYNSNGVGGLSVPMRIKLG